MFGDGATLSSSAGPPQNEHARSNLWKNVWVSTNEERQGVASSLSNLLFFMRDPIAGELILNVRKISHDKAQLSQKFETMSSKGFLGDTLLD